MSAEREPVIEARGLTKRYGALTAVERIDFTVRSQECFGFLGPNGAGKTTITRMMVGGARVTAGELWVDGKNVRRDARAIKYHLGVVPQEENLDSNLTVLGNLLSYARCFDIPGKVARDRSLESLGLFQLRERAHSSIDTLSGGMKRRLLIARALLNQPRVLVLDEPTAGLDPQARHLVWRKLRHLKAQGITMVLTTHYMDEAAYLCDRLVIMDRGRILAEGSPQELVRRYAGREVLEVRPDDVPKDEVMRRLRERGLDVEDAGDVIHAFARGDQALPRDVDGEGVQTTHRSATLEDVFLRLTGRGLREE